MRLNRLSEMEHYIYKKGNVTLYELAEQFDISLNTVRRDITEITKNKTVKKVYGGVISVPSNSVIPKVERISSNQSAKRKIGQIAAKLVKSNSTIFIDTGTTATNIVPYLVNVQNVTVITNSLEVMEQVIQYPNLSLFNLGGFYNKDVDAFVGISVTDCLNRLSFDIAFVSATGISDNGDLSVDGYYEQPIKAAVLSKKAHSYYLLADSTKFHQTGVLAFGHLKDMDAIITEAMPEAPYAKLLKKLNTAILLE